MKKQRQLHLWIGLVTSVLILVEAVTGLFISEPWLIVMKQPQIEQRMQKDGLTNPGQNFGGGSFQPSNISMSKGQDITQVQQLDRGPQGDFSRENGGNSVIRVIKNLHAGRIGNTDIKIFADIAAIGLIILTITGIYLSIKILRVQFKNKSDILSS